MNVANVEDLMEDKYQQVPSKSRKIEGRITKFLLRYDNSI